MSASDAQMLWMSATIPSDQFLLYCFDDAAETFEDVRARVLARATTVDALQLSVREVPFALDYPQWVPRTIMESDVVHHALGTPTWLACRSAVEDLVTTAVDVHDTPWRLHVFDSVRDAPRCSESALVVLLQVSHALVDGRGASDLARRLFGSDRAVPHRPRREWTAAFPTVVAAGRFPAQIASLVRRGRAAHRATAQLARDTTDGVVPAPADGRARLPVNTRPDNRRTVRPIVCDASDLRSAAATVTVGALTAVSSALANYLREHGRDVPDDLGAETTLGKEGESLSANNFRNAGVDLYPNVADLGERARLITASMQARRERFAHPSFAAADRATALVPAPLMKWGTRQFDADAVPDLVTGHTVVSSVNRGPADLVLGGGRVAWTAGFPGLSPVMGLTHGVHGIGDTVTLSITTSPAVMPDADRYEHLLRAAVADVGRAFRGQ